MAKTTDMTCSHPIFAFLDIHWHFIGHLQSNKSNKLCSIPNLHAVHSVDSVKLATALNHSWGKYLDERKRQLLVFVQVNTSSEDAKSGVAPGDQCVELVQHIVENCEGVHELTYSSNTILSLFL